MASSALTSRKKVSIECQPLTEPEAPSPSINSQNKKQQEKYDCSTKLLILVAILLLGFIFIVPKQQRARHYRAINEQFAKAVTVVEGHKQYMLDKHESLTTTIKDEELQKQKEEIASKQNHIDELEERIKKHKQELQFVKKMIKQENDDVSKFCWDCEMEIELGGQVKKMNCINRLHFIVKRYNKDKDSVKEELMKEYPNCKKK